MDVAEGPVGAVGITFLRPISKRDVYLLLFLRKLDVNLKKKKKKSGYLIGNF